MGDRDPLVFAYAERVFKFTATLSHGLKGSEVIDGAAMAAGMLLAMHEAQLHHHSGHQEIDSDDLLEDFTERVAEMFEHYKGQVPGLIRMIQSHQEG